MPLAPHCWIREPGMTVTSEPVELTGSSTRSAVTVISPSCDDVGLGAGEGRQQRRKQNCGERAAGRLFELDHDDPPAVPPTAAG